MTKQDERIDQAIEEVFDILCKMHYKGEACIFETYKENGCLACQCQEILNRKGVRRSKSAQ